MKAFRIFVPFALFFGFVINTGCFKGKEFPSGFPVITGKVYSRADYRPLKNVAITVEALGKTYQVLTNDDGEFRVEAREIKKGVDVKVNISISNFVPITKVFTVRLGLNDLGTITLLPTYGAPVKTVIGGSVLDDNTNVPLAGVKVEVTDSKGGRIVAYTNGSGQFTLTSDYFTLGSEYVLTFSKDGYNTATAKVKIMSTTQINYYDGNPIHLRKVVWITGTVEDADNSSAPIPNVIVSTTDSNGNLVTAITDSNGNFTLNSSGFYIGENYGISFTRPGYIDRGYSISITTGGENSVGTILMNQSPSLAGKVVNQNGEPVVGAIVTVTGDSGPMETTTNELGEWYFPNENSANFTSGNYYTINASATGYSSGSTDCQAGTGRTDCGSISLEGIVIDGMTISGIVKSDWTGNGIDGVSISVSDEDGVTHTTTTSSDGSFSVTGKFQFGDSYTLVMSKDGFIGETTISPKHSFIVDSTGDMNLGDIYLYPVGIMAYIEGSLVFFQVSVKQTIEPFITEVNGFTVSARNGTDRNTFSTFYLHTDATGTGTYYTDSIVISYYDGVNKKLYIAGHNERSSSGVISISHFGDVGASDGFIRGTFTGSLYIISTSSDVVSVTNGKFNIIRSE